MHPETSIVLHSTMQNSHFHCASENGLRVLPDNPKTAPGILALAAGTAARAAHTPADMMLHPPIAGTIPATDPDAKMYSAMGLPSAGKLMHGTSQAAFTSWTGLVNGSFWETRYWISALTPTGSYCDSSNSSTMTSMRLTALPSPPTDGCHSASTWDYARISHGSLWWPTPHIRPSVLISSPISTSWWTANTIAYWTGSHRYLYRPKLPAR